MKIRMVLQKRFLPIVLKVWEPRSFHGNGLFSRAESAAYANFKVPIVEEPLKQKEKKSKTIPRKSLHGFIQTKNFI